MSVSESDLGVFKRKERMKDTIFLWSNVQSSVELNLKGAIKVQTKPLIWKKPPSLIMIKMKLNDFC